MKIGIWDLEIYSLFSLFYFLFSNRVSCLLVLGSCLLFIVYCFGCWNLEFGILEFGIWCLVLGAWNFEF